MPTRVRVQDLYDFLRERLSLTWIAGRDGGTRPLTPSGEHQPARIVAGPLNLIHPNHVQVIGPAEADFLDGLAAGERAKALRQLIAYEPIALVCAAGVEPADDLLPLAEAHDVPVFSSPLPDIQVIDNLQYFGSLFLARKTTLHGVFLEVLGMGVLLTGDAAVGKSELALELISRGNRLIADDAPEFSRIAPDIVSGACPPLLRDFLEVRGLGILNIRAMFGDSAIKRTKYLRLIVHLKRMTPDELARMDRLASAGKPTDVLGVQIPVVTVPVAPGRNLAILVESAVRNHLLKLEGYDAVEAFVKRQERALQQQ
ncbi:MAG: HPr(Ser) kinase/phosphatase [Gammaproteobacteria bacterium]|jgi:HPr kinase/phosphorylase